MDSDLRERLDASFGDGPEHTPLETRLASGRQALRNRRLALAAGAVAAVTVATIGAVTVQDPGSDRGDKAPVAPRPTEAADPTALPVDDAWRANCGHAGQDTCEALLAELPPVLVLEDGTAARTTQDVQVFQAVEDPVTTGVESVAVETQFQGLTRWWLVIRRSNGAVVAEQMDPALSTVGFEEWAAQLGDPGREPGARVTLPPA
jgi:hypothetical protein